MTDLLSASLTSTRNSQNFPNRIGSSLKVIHLYHHGSELTKLPGSKIWPSWALRRGVHTRLAGVNSSRSPTQLLPHTRSRTPGRGILGHTLRLSPPTNQVPTSGSTGETARPTALQLRHPTRFFVPKPQSSTSLLFTPSQRAWFPFTWTLSSHSLLGDMRPLEFTIMINLSPYWKRNWSYSVFQPRGLIFRLFEFQWFAVNH